MEIIEFKEKIYPLFQTQGNAARFAIPFAEEIIGNKSNGFDISCNRPEWSFPGATMIDLEIDDEYDAYNLPDTLVDYIFSSHCLEHLPHWVNALDYWTSKLSPGGILFLYLPDYSQEYWRPWNCRKHINVLTPKMIKDYLESSDEYTKIIATEGYDLNNSFYVIAEKI